MNKAYIGLVMVLVCSLAYAITTRPPGLEGPGLVDGGTGSVPLNMQVTPATSMLSIYAEVDCFDEARTAMDGMPERNVVFAMKIFHDDPNFIANNPAGYEYYSVPFLLYSGWTDEPDVALPQVNLQDPLFIRYEGRQPPANYGCFAFGQVVHDRYESGTLKETYYTNNAASPTWVRMPNFSYTVDWDNNQNNCEVLGGAWLPGYGCCGDDWIWIYNKALNYQPRPVNQIINLESTDDLCLYGGVSILGDDKGMGVNSYYCDNADLDHIAYDYPKLQYDDPAYDDTSTILPKPGAAWFFAGAGTTETDIGIWSDANGQNPRVCSIDFENAAGGIKFKWQTVQEAATNKVLCNVMGYNWTGSQCCGAPGVAPTYDDPVKECNGEAVYNTLLGMYSGMVGAENLIAQPFFQAEYSRLCTEYLTLPGYSDNKACYSGQTVKNNTILVTNGMAKIFNENGVLYDCTTPCQTRGNVAVCTHEGNWSKNTDNFAVETLGSDQYMSSDQAEIKAAVHDSSVPSAVSGIDKPKECCFSNACWDGESCAALGSAYELDNGNWQMYDEHSSASKVVYMCSNGTWMEAEQRYDWFVNTEEPYYCLHDYQCGCDSGDCGTHSASGCTDMPMYYTGDRLCEDKQWTSRTRLLAEQMIELGGSQYTLFCDRFDRSINYYEPLAPAADDINSVCVLNTGDSVALGFTLNLGYEGYRAALDAVLRDKIAAALDDDLATCDNAVSASSGYGTFRRCDTANNKFFYNNKTQMVIYIRDGYNGDSLSWSQQPKLPGYFDAMKNYINANAAQINSHDVPLHIENFANANKFDRVYIAKTSVDFVFGLVEELHVPEASPIGSQGRNRFYLGMLYQNVDGVSCSQVMGADPDIYCAQSGSNRFLFKRKTDSNFAFWKDLSAKLRYR